MLCMADDIVSRLLPEIKEFATSASWLSSQDAASICRIVPLYRVRADNLETALQSHMDLVQDLAWLTSKAERLVADTEAKVSKRRGWVVDTEVRINGGEGVRLTKVVLDGLIEADTAYQKLIEELAQKKQWLSYLNTLKWGLKDRIQITNQLCMRTAGTGV